MSMVKDWERIWSSAHSKNAVLQQMLMVRKLFRLIFGDYKIMSYLHLQVKKKKDDWEWVTDNDDNANNNCAPDFWQISNSDDENKD